MEQVESLSHLTSNSQLRALTRLLAKSKLHLFHLTAHQVRASCLQLSSALMPIQVLDYLKSPKGSLGKTAGCFSLLARDATTQLQPAASQDQVNILRMAMQSTIGIRQTPAPLPMDDFASLAKSGAAISRCDPH